MEQTLWRVMQKTYAQVGVLYIKSRVIEKIVFFISRQIRYSHYLTCSKTKYIIKLRRQKLWKSLIETGLFAH
jgi:hypothetical protein